MEYQTTLKKGHDGYSAETNVVLGEVESGTRILRVSTYKYSRGGLWSCATVGIEKNEGGYTSFSFMMYQDFHKGFNFTPAKRVTEKSVMEAHKVALSMLPAIVEEAKQQYSKELAA
jgi:hypothetical protein